MMSEVNYVRKRIQGYYFYKAEIAFELQAMHTYRDFILSKHNWNSNINLSRKVIPFTNQIRCIIETATLEINYRKNDMENLMK